MNVIKTEILMDSNGKEVLVTVNGSYIDALGNSQAYYEMFPSSTLAMQAVQSLRKRGAEFQAVTVRSGI